MHIRRAYNDIRILLGIVIRDLDLTRKAAKTGDSAARASIEKVKQTVQQGDSLVNGSLDMLVREELITPWMATSLMNDGAYAQHAARCLIRMTERILTVDEAEFPDEEGTPLARRSSSSDWQRCHRTEGAKNGKSWTP